MTLQDWGAIGEAIGGLAIIISLIYVGLQIRQNTRANRAATTQPFVDSFSGPSLKLIGSEFTKVFSRGLEGLEQLEGSERIEFTVWCMQVFRLWESYYFQWKEGYFDPQIWKGFKTQLSDLFSYQGVRDFWAIRKHHFSDEFQVFVSQLTSAASSKNIYGENLNRSES